MRTRLHDTHGLTWHHVLIVACTAVAMVLTKQTALAQLTATDSVITDTTGALGPINPIRAAITQYQRTGIARPVQTGTAIAFPYGKTQPILTCAALRICLIELQAGETIVGIPPRGDTERWRIQTATWGPNGTHPVVVVKPLNCDLTTNLVILTNKHLYDLTLDAPPCPGPEQADIPIASYTRRLTFYYPDEELAVWEQQIPLTPAVGGERRAWESLHYGYRWTKDKGFPWTPAVVFDDGAHLYVKIPTRATHAVAPVLFAVDTDGVTSLLNYTIRNGFYITDRVVNRAALVLGINGKNHRVLITREEP